MQTAVYKKLEIKHTYGHLVGIICLLGNKKVPLHSIKEDVAYINKANLQKKY